ncbi:OmpA/MotB family protein [Corallococcus macrosporus]|uniref:Chemotaxis protein MotB n=2 Tax=Myxococcaceae TaxID=31 RepID=A0A250JQ90_9BACT|nr:OmpA family protein [Corallococcus macrosporus]AEI62819.1 putative chemotaxis protein MotB [Corallococcus macrosporus]ATB45286.1 chemotaxis protein MotB [Corallococcus macrosporus DSM 14697]
MRNRLVLAALVALSTTGCVSQGKYDAKALEAENFAKGLTDEKGAREAAEAKVKELEGKIAALEQEKEALNTRLATAESRLTANAAERRALEEKNAQLAALNEELARNTKKLAQAKEELEKRSSEYENLAQSLKQEISDGKIELSELKGKMTVQLKDKILFASGSARVGKEGDEALKKIADALKTVQGKIIRVEGHTDDVPTGGGQFASNWELSLARAMAVVRSLQDAGVDPTFLSAAGYGQYQPIAANDSAENRSLNRRIEIVLAPK